MDNIGEFISERGMHMDSGKMQKKNVVTISIVACVVIVLIGAMIGGSGVLKNDDPFAADTVVYGKIYTSDDGQYVEAFAVKDGRYIYVGDEEGAEDYIGKNTKVIDYRDKGLIMSGATEGHGHYVAQGVLVYFNYFVYGNTEAEILDNLRTYIEANPDRDFYYTFGWGNVAMQNIKEKIDMRTKLDAICSDKPIIATDDTAHNAFCNSKALDMAGITVDTTIQGGVIGVVDGKLSGLVSDMAYNYLSKKTVAIMDIIPEADYAGVVEATQKELHSKGYTYYHDGTTNFFGTQIMDCLSTYDKTAGLKIYASGSYKIDPYEDWEAELENAVAIMNKYPTAHFKYNTLKLFADGEAVESKSGWMIEGYVDGTHGTQVWDDDVINAIVKAANEAGISVHVHAQGDGATEQAVNAFIYAEDTAADGIYNGICHGRNFTEETKDKMAEHGIYAAININWRTLYSVNQADEVAQLLSNDLAKAGYPVKSLLDRGIVITSSTDVPAASGAPTTVSGIIEVAVNDTCPGKDVWKLDESERVTVEEAMDIMTINGAIQLQIDDERGSIEVGKFADFVLFDMDFTSCEKDRIHEANVVSVYFEGNEVYTA